MSRSNLRTPWPIPFKFHRVIEIDGLAVCILYGEISNLAAPRAHDTPVVNIHTIFVDFLSHNSGMKN
jgi:hypothetical protein